MLTFTRESSSEAHTQEIAAEVAACLRPRDVIALDGALGAGKTSFVRGLVRGLGGDPRQVSSPTFVLHQEYAVGGRDEAHRQSSIASRQSEISNVAHIDAWRMTGAHDLETIGWEELLAREDAVIAIEWPTKIPQELLPRLRTVRIQFEVVGQSHRRLSFAIPTAIEERFARLEHRGPARACRTCGRSVSVEGPFFPFCSERCKLADLGGWFSEKYTITRPIEQRDVEEE